MRLKSKPQWSYDPACERLALYFLAEIQPRETEAQIRSLSQAIQNAVEDWFFELEHPTGDLFAEKATDAD